MFSWIDYFFTVAWSLAELTLTTFEFLYMVVVPLIYIVIVPVTSVLVFLNSKKR
jgi:hypothetical protein